MTKRKDFILRLGRYVLHAIYYRDEERWVSVSLEQWRNGGCKILRRGRFTLPI